MKSDCFSFSVHRNNDTHTIVGTVYSGGYFIRSGIIQINLYANCALCTLPYLTGMESFMADNSAYVYT